MEGKQQSSVEVSLFKDGKELTIGKDANVNMSGDKVTLTVINPRREKSGTYKVIMSNSQGQDEQEVEVNILGEADKFYIRRQTIPFSVTSII